MPLSILFIQLAVVGHGSSFTSGWFSPHSEDVARSSSGQFVVFRAGGKPGGSSHRIIPQEYQNHKLLAISCERIKQAVLESFGLKDSWNGQITGHGKVKIYFEEKPREKLPPVVVQRVYSPARMGVIAGWQYRVLVNGVVEEEVMVRAIVQIVLETITTRPGQNKLAEIPPWLIEGLVQFLKNRPGPSLVPTSEIGRGNSSPYYFADSKWKGKSPGDLFPHYKTDQRIHRYAPFKEVRSRISGKTPLTFSLLSYPESELFEGDSWQTYKDFSHILFHQLKSMKQGSAYFKEFLNLIPNYLNWQLAFLEAFGEIFTRPIDIEKWWAVNLMLFLEKEDMNYWHKWLAMERLDQLLKIPVNLRVQRNSAPIQSTVSLSDVIREWNLGQVREAFLQKMLGLQALRIRTPPRIALLVDGYLEVIRVYVAKTQRLDWNRNGKGLGDRNLRVLISGLLKRLETLEENRTALAAEYSVIPEGAAETQVKDSPGNPESVPLDRS